MAAWQGWETAFLDAIGAPVNAATVAFVDAWQGFEAGSATFNPLNTTQSAPGATWYNSFGPGGQYHVLNYPDEGTGLSATVATITNGYYPDLLAALRSGSPLTYSNQSGLAANLNTWGSGTSWFSKIGGTPASSSSGSTASGDCQPGFNRPYPGGPCLPGLGGADTLTSPQAKAAASNALSGIYTPLIQGIELDALMIVAVFGAIGALIFMALSNQQVRETATTAAKGAALA